MLCQSVRQVASEINATERAVVQQKKGGTMRSSHFNIIDLSAYATSRLWAGRLAG